MLATLLIAIRDVLLATALAWVGVTIEQREPPCSADTCQTQSE
jgi:hypothetical protein